MWWRRRVASWVIGVGVLMGASGVQAANPTATIETSKGRMVIELYPGEAPKTVANFIKLATQGFYTRLIFHRVIPGFMVQTGDPTGTGRGGPGYTFEDEMSPTLKFDGPGVVAMANAGPNTNGSQFFITVAATPWLNGKHTIFGHVREGQDVVEAIVAVPRNSQDRPLTDVAMTQITIHESPQ